MPRKSRRPNILFLMTDQHRHDGLGCANPLVKTPNLDALAARGVRFTQAVCNVPMCVPSRYSMMTGHYGCQIGVKHNTQIIPCDDQLPAPVLAQRLAEAGYQTAGFGKTHWYVGSRIMPEVDIQGSRRGFEVRALARKSEPRNIEPGSRYMGEDIPGRFSRITQEMAKGGPGGESEPGYTGGTSVVSADEHKEAWLTDQALEFLADGRDPDRPFFLYLSFDYPHPPLFVPPEFEALYDLDDFGDTPPPDPMPVSHAPNRLEGIWPKMTPQERRLARLRYAALCTYVDSQFGRVIDRLRDLGELDRTLVLFAADHGEMLGDRGRVSKYCLYEGSVRVPMILAGAGVGRAGDVDHRPVELVDVLPTLLDAAGCEVPETLPGFSLLSDFSRDGSFCEMHGRGYEEYQKAPAVMYRTREWKLILSLPGHLDEAFHRYDRIRGELYHLADDPLELNNLYGAEEHAAVREDLTRRVLMHVMCALGRFPRGAARARLRVTAPPTRPDASIWPQDKERPAGSEPAGK